MSRERKRLETAIIGPYAKPPQALDEAEMLKGYNIGTIKSLCCFRFKSKARRSVVSP